MYIHAVSMDTATPSIVIWLGVIPIFSSGVTPFCMMASNCFFRLLETKVATNRV